MKLLNYLERRLYAMRNWYYKRQGFIHDPGKRMWFKTRSTCCNATVHGVTMIKGKPISKPFSQYPDKQKKNIYWRDWCNNCHRQCTTVTEVRA